MTELLYKIVSFRKVFINCFLAPKINIIIITSLPFSLDTPRCEVNINMYTLMCKI